MGIVAAMAMWPLTGSVRAQATDEQVFGATTTASAMLCDQLANMARAVVMGEGDPHPEQIVQSRALVDMALQLSPDRADLWRLSAELAVAEQDPAERIRAMREYTRLRPDDDAAQFQYILLRLDALQTVEQRVAAVERILDARAAAQLSAALRSRLASYAAAAAYDNGDTRRYLERLQQALKLDDTNAHAAWMFYGRAVRRGESTSAVGAALYRVLRAAPTSAQARQRVGDLLLAQGEYAFAAQQYQAVLLLATDTPGPAAIYRMVLSHVAAGSNDTALQLLSEYEQVLRAGDPEARLSMDLELLRMTIYSLLGDVTRTDASYGRLQGRLLREVEAGDARARVDLARLGALVGRALDEAEAVATALPDDDADRALIVGWVAVHRGRAVAARQALTPIADDNAFAAIGLARIEPTGEIEKRAALLRRAADMARGQLAGAVAVRELAAIGLDPTRSALGRRLVELFQQLPSHVLMPQPDRKSWVMLSIDVTPQHSRYLDPLHVSIRLQNATDIALSLGADGTLPTRLFIYVAPSIAGGGLGDLPPIVVDLGRRLRLDAGETLTVDARLDLSELGMMLALNPMETISFNATAVLDPKPTLEGRVHHGLFGARAADNLLRRIGRPVTAENLDLWGRELEEPTDRTELFRTIARLGSLLTRFDMEDEEQRNLATTLGSAVENEFVEAADDPVARAWVVLTAALGTEQVGLLGRVFDAVQRSDEPILWVPYLTKHVADPQSNAINTALRSDNQTVARVAQAVRIALQRRAAEQAAEDAAAREAEQLPPIDIPMP